MPSYRVPSDELEKVLNQAIDSFLEYRSKDGYDDTRAKETAVFDTVEALHAEMEQAKREGKESRVSMFDGMPVFVVEFRQHISTGTEEGSRFSYSAVTAHLASSLEEAVNWCKKNTAFEEHNPKKVWDFAIRRRQMNSDLKGGGLVTVLDWNGEVTGWKV